MRILCIGDVVGSIGCEFLRNNLPTLKKVKGVDFVICNGENSADGNGLTPVSAKHLFDSGVDAITLGNHSFRRKEVYDCLDSNPFIVRPANFPENSTPGKGIINVDTGRRIVSIINILGNSYMDNNLNCPFFTCCLCMKINNYDFAFSLFNHFIYTFKSAIQVVIHIGITHNIYN